MPFVNMWSVLPFLTVPLSVVMDSHEMPFVKRWSVLPSVVWNEFSNAYSQNKSAEMPLVQKESSIPHVLLKHHWSRKEFTEGVLKCHLPQDTFQRITKSRLEPYNYISCLEQPSDPDSKDNQLSATHYFWSKFNWKGRRRPSWRGGDGPTYCWKKEVDRVGIRAEDHPWTLVQLQVGTWS
jgi:hypothetical protein